MGVTWAREELARGGCDAIIEIAVNARAEALAHCDDLHLHADMAFQDVVDYNLMREDDLALMLHRYEYLEMEHRQLGDKVKGASDRSASAAQTSYSPKAKKPRAERKPRWRDSAKDALPDATAW